MKWVSLLKDFKERVGLSQPPSVESSPSSASSSSARDSNATTSTAQEFAASSPSRFVVSVREPTVYLWFLFVH